MARKDNLVGGALLGAGLMYLLDPDRGRRRRAMLRDQMVHLVNRTPDAAETAVRDLYHRAQGLAAEAGSRLRSDTADEVVVEARVRAELGRLVSHPGAIQVAAQDGRVTLGGPVLAHEVDPLLKGVQSVPGVQAVVNSLEVHEAPGTFRACRGRGGRGRAARSCSRRTGRPPPESSWGWWVERSPCAECGGGARSMEPRRWRGSESWPAHSPTCLPAASSGSGQGAARSTFTRP